MFKLPQIARHTAFAAALVLAGAGFLAAESPAQANEAPSSLARAVDEALLEAMRQSDQLGYAGRYETLDPVLRKSFNFPYMARVSVGRHWRGLSNEDKRSLVEAFTRLSIATFASRFNGYSGERFEVTGEKEQPRGAVLVFNHLVKSDGEAIAINYLMRKGKSASEWRIIDVYLEAKYSELATKRSEFTSAFKRKGLAGLLAIIEQKIAGLANKAESASAN